MSKINIAHSTHPIGNTDSCQLDLCYLMCTETCHQKLNLCCIEDRQGGDTVITQQSNYVQSENIPLIVSWGQSLSIVAHFKFLTGWKTRCHFGTKKECPGVWFLNSFSLENNIRTGCVWQYSAVAAITQNPIAIFIFLTTSHF